MNLDQPQTIVVAKVTMVASYFIVRSYTMFMDRKSLEPWKLLNREFWDSEGNIGCKREICGFYSLEFL